MLALFCNLVALSLGSNCVECLRVTKIAKETKFEEVWGNLEEKVFLEVTIHKIFETNSSFHVK